jgi:hypothetical protein
VCDTGGTNSEGDPECTLRAAIEEANALGGGPITFAIPGSDSGHTSRRRLLANSIVGNAGLGIDLSDNGVTANDPATSTPGCQRPPQLPGDGVGGGYGRGPSTSRSVWTCRPGTTGSSSSPTRLVPTRAVSARARCSCTPSTVSHPGGVAELSASFAGSAGDIITATTTEDLGGGSYGSTSEFSAVIEVNAPPTPSTTP